MSNSMKRSRLTMLAVSVCVAVCSLPAYAKKDTELVKQEAGYYYGYAKGAGVEATSLEAKRDLVGSALTTTVRAADPKAASITVSEASAKARLADMKPYAQTKSTTSPAITYRIKITDWDKAEKVYQNSLRTELSDRVSSLSGKRAAADKLNDALAILARLADEGETELLTAEETGSELLSRKVEAVVKETADSLVMKLSVPDGLVNPTTKYSVKVVDASGSAVANLMLSVLWETPELPTDAANATAAEVRATVKTDALGTAAIEYPLSEEYHNRPVTLTVSTSFAMAVPSSATLKKIDVENAVDGCYVHYDDEQATFAAVTVPAGKFNAGAVSQDTRAGKKEATRSVTTDSYAIDVGPVTNAHYAAFLHATRAETMPEFFDNSDYNQGMQPVVGVSASDAQAYAEWLSAQTGRTYRLPTEEEWEKAARAGKESIYPWGDDSPAEGKKANYKGNGSFEAPSPVGSFESGNNAWGLKDMAGNVWEWTSSTHSKDTASTLRVVKGGSWMDGPADLRVSNFRELDGQKGYPDVGFRLVMEVSK